MPEKLCSEIIAPFASRATADDGLPPIQVMGGNGSAALTNPDTVIDFDAGEIWAPPSSDLGRFRDNGTKRDADILVLSSHPWDVAAIEASASELIGDQLEVSVFGLKRYIDLDMQRSRPVRSSLKVFLGDRYVDGVSQGFDGQASIIEGYKSVYPFQTPIDSETLATFQLHVGDAEPVPTTHPGATLLNYLTRSISGLRPKDVEKIERVSDQVLGKHPEVKEWVHDGPGKGTFELARLLHTVREPRESPGTLELGQHLRVEPHDFDKLAEHPGFMAADFSPKAQKAVLEAAHLKGRILHFGEGQERVVAFWQGRVERLIHSIIHNE